MPAPSASPPVDVVPGPVFSSCRAYALSDENLAQVGLHVEDDVARLFYEAHRPRIPTPEAFEEKSDSVHNSAPVPKVSLFNTCGVAFSLIPFRAFYVV